LTFYHHRQADSFVPTVPATHKTLPQISQTATVTLEGDPCAHAPGGMPLLVHRKPILLLNRVDETDDGNQLSLGAR